MSAIHPGFIWNRQDGSIPNPSQQRDELCDAHDATLDPLFQGGADATEQAIVHALLHARSVTGYLGRTRKAVTEVLPNWRDLLQTENPCEY